MQDYLIWKGWSKYMTENLTKHDSTNHIVIDTNIFIENLEGLKDRVDKISGDSAEETFVVITTVLEELDNLKMSKNEDVAYRARRALNYIEDYEDCFEFYVSENEDITKADNIILDFCKVNNYCIATYDRAMRIKSHVRDIDVINIGKKDRFEHFKGYTVVEIDMEDEEEQRFYASLYESPEQNKHDLYVNEYLIIRDKSSEKYDKDGEFIGYSTTDILRWNGSRLVGLKTPHKSVISPLNDLQRCALDLLYNQDIPIKIIAGAYGSGKTKLSVAVGHHLVEEKDLYSKLVFVRNHDMDNGADSIGALPGTLQDKTDLYFHPLTQHLPMGDFHAEKMEREGKLEKHVTCLIKGLSISGFMINDESGDLTIKDIKRVGSRIQDGCVVFCGDWEQSEGKYMKNNGLLHLINHTKDEPLTGVVVLDRDVRSPGSRVFASL